MKPEIPQDQIVITLERQDEDTPHVGNCMASGDDEVDRQQEEWVREQLEQGNEWAWCRVKVTAKWRGYRGDDYLGCCSYLSEADFRQPGGYYDDMVESAVADLQDSFSRILQETILAAAACGMRVADLQPADLETPT